MIGTVLGVFAVAATLIRLIIPLLAARLREAAVIAGAMVSTAAAVPGSIPWFSRRGRWPRCRWALAWHWGRCSPWS